MPAPRSTRFQRLPAGRKRLAGHLIHALRKRSVRFSAAALERTVFAPLPRDLGWLLRVPLRAMLAADLGTIEPAFETDFYLAQHEDPRERSIAAVDPLLHYATIGRLRSRSPARHFDPTHYRRSIGLSLLRDPFAHWLTVGRAAGYPCNTSEAIPRPSADAGSEVVLVMDHARAGGSRRYISLFEAKIQAEGARILRLHHVPGTRRLALWEGGDQVEGNRASAQIFDLLADEDAFVAHAVKAGVSRILVNHVIDRPIEIFEWISRVSDRIGCRFDVILHDYYFLCPRVNAVDGSGRFCGLAPDDVCRRCIDAFGSEVGGVDPAVWRRTSLACLAKADRIYVPSRDIAERFAPFLQGKACEVWEPEADDDRPPEVAPEIADDRPMRVAILGSLNVAKGSRVLLALADEASRRHAPLQFTILGPSDESAALTQLGVSVHGRYENRDLPALFAGLAPDVVFLPALWPETWSFILSFALDRGLPVIAFDIGAPAQRLRRLERGRLLPMELADDPAGLLDALLRLRSQWAKPT